MWKVLTLSAPEEHMLLLKNPRPWQCVQSIRISACIAGMLNTNKLPQMWSNVPQKDVWIFTLHLYVLNYAQGKEKQEGINQVQTELHIIIMIDNRSIKYAHDTKYETLWPR